MQNNISRTYLRSALRSVPCTHRQKKQFRHDLTKSVSNYCIENPNAELTDLIHAFGTPEQIASAWINDYADSNHFFYQRTKQHAIRIAVAVLMIAAVTVCTISIVNYIKRQDFREGYAIDRIVEESTTTEEDEKPLEVH